MQTFQGVIDKAAKLCGSQKELAERLGVTPQAVTHAKNCRQPLKAEALAILGEITGTDPARLWELQELANMPRRNPFIRAASAVLGAFLCVVLSVGENDARADAYWSKSNQATSDRLHIVRFLFLALLGVLGLNARPSCR